MPFLLQPWHILLAALCGMVNERQQQIIEFQNAQIETLLKKLGKKRLLLDDNQRRLLAVKAHAIGRKALLELTTIFTPDTILRWHRELVAKKFDSSNKRQPGRPRIRQEIVDAIVRFATENPTWGYDRIQGALKNVGYHIADSTVANVLKAHGIEPAPDRQRTPAWSTFLKAHWEFYLCHGLHDCRSLDAKRTGDVLRSRRDASENPSRPHCRDHAESECHVDETGLPQSDRLRRRIPERRQASHCGSRYELHRHAGIPGAEHGH